MKAFMAIPEVKVGLEAAATARTGLLANAQQIRAEVLKLASEKWEQLDGARQCEIFAGWREVIDHEDYLKHNDAAELRAILRPDGPMDLSEAPRAPVAAMEVVPDEPEQAPPTKRSCGRPYEPLLNLSRGRRSEALNDIFAMATRHCKDDFDAEVLLRGLLKRFQERFPEAVERFTADWKARSAKQEEFHKHLANLRRTKVIITNPDALRAVAVCIAKCFSSRRAAKAAGIHISRKRFQVAQGVKEDKRLKIGRPGKANNPGLMQLVC